MPAGQGIINSLDESIRFFFLYITCTVFGIVILFVQTMKECNHFFCHDNAVFVDVADVNC